MEAEQHCRISTVFLETLVISRSHMLRTVEFTVDVATCYSHVGGGLRARCADH